MKTHVKKKHDEKIGLEVDLSKETNNLEMESHYPVDNSDANDQTKEEVKKTPELANTAIRFQEAPISSSTEATKPSEAFLQTISSGMIYI